MTAKSIRVMCVDDHTLVREGIRLLLSQQPDIKIVASVATGEECVKAFREKRPDVTLMDLRLPGMDGLEAIRAIRAEFPDARIIVVTMYEGEEDIYQALQAGAVTYVMKDAIPDELVTIVRDVHAGKRPLAPLVEARLNDRTAHPALSSRELQVLELLAQGLRNKEIAAALGIAYETVQVHLKNLYSKLQVHHRTTAVRVAARRGIIHID